jgi:hypothetical protein
VYYTMSKETETQPYRLFKEFLDTIIKIPEELKNKLANEFERRRIEKMNAPVIETPSEDKSMFDSMFSKKETDDKSMFDSMFSKKETDDKSMFDSMFSKKETDDKSMFDSMFSKKETDDMINKFSEPITPPQKKCQIRPW